MKGLLKDKLDQVELPVPDHLWANVSSQIGSGTATTAATSAGLGAVKTAVLALVAASIVGVGAWYMASQDNSSAAQQQSTRPAPSTPNEKSNDGPIVPSGTTIEKQQTPVSLLTKEEALDSKLDIDSKEKITQDNENKTPGDVVAASHVNSSFEPFPTPDLSSFEQLPQASALFSLTNESEGHVVFVPKETNADAMYFWDFGDSNTSTEERPQHQYQEPGTYYATLTVTDSEGHSVSSAQEVAIHRRNDLQIMNIMTPNGDGYNDIFDPAGLEDGVNIDYLLIMSLQGATIYESTEATTWDGKLSSGEDAPSGAYIYLVRGKDKNNGIIEKSSKLTLKR